MINNGNSSASRIKIDFINTANVLLELLQFNVKKKIRLHCYIVTNVKKSESVHWISDEMLKKYLKACTRLFHDTNGLLGKFTTKKTVKIKLVQK